MTSSEKKGFAIAGASAPTPESTTDTHEKIKEIVHSSRVVLFMKGSPSMPQCGFSQRAVALIRQFTEDFSAVDVLQDPAIRQGIKEFSDWPTIPQCYIDGEFIGGSDILMEMHANGELAKLLS